MRFSSTCNTQDITVSFKRRNNLCLRERTQKWRFFRAEEQSEQEELVLVYMKNMEHGGKAAKSSLSLSLSLSLTSHAPIGHGHGNVYKAGVINKCEAENSRELAAIISDLSL